MKNKFNIEFIKNGIDTENCISSKWLSKKRIVNNNNIGIEIVKSYK